MLPSRLLAEVLGILLQDPDEDAGPGPGRAEPEAVPDEPRDPVRRIGVERRVEAPDYGFRLRAAAQLEQGVRPHGVGQPGVAPAPVVPFVGRPGVHPFERRERLGRPTPEGQEVARQQQRVPDPDRRPRVRIAAQPLDDPVAQSGGLRQRAVVRAFAVPQRRGLQETGLGELPPPGRQVFAGRSLEHPIRVPGGLLQPPEPGRQATPIQARLQHRRNERPLGPALEPPLHFLETLERLVVPTQPRKRLPPHFHRPGHAHENPVVPARPEPPQALPASRFGSRQVVPLEEDMPLRHIGRSQQVVGNARLLFQGEHLFRYRHDPSQVVGGHRLPQVLEQGLAHRLGETRFLHRPAQPPCGRRLARCVAQHRPRQAREFLLRVEGSHEADELTHDRRLVALPTKFVVDAKQPFGGRVRAFLAVFLREQQPPVGQSSEQRRDRADVHPRPVRDLLAARRLPEIDRRDIHPALRPGEPFEMAAEVLGVVVHERRQLLHEFPKRPPRAEPRHDDEKTGITPGEDFKRPDIPSSRGVRSKRAPQLRTVLRAERFQVQDTEHSVERRPVFVLSEGAVGRGPQEDDLRFRLQGLPQFPSEVIAGRSAASQGLEVLDHENELPPEAVRGFQHGGPGLKGQLLAAPARRQDAMDFTQFTGNVGGDFRGLAREVEERLAPEVADVQYLVVLLREPDRQQFLGEFRRPADLRRHARQQHRLA